MSKGKCVYGRSQGALRSRREEEEDVGMEEVPRKAARSRREEEEDVGREEVEEELKVKEEKGGRCGEMEGSHLDCAYPKGSNDGRQNTYWRERDEERRMLNKCCGEVDRGELEVE
ncbi:hypothetical protein CSOJ01_11186 [Colletotrichum sojae]|uniref:Uncharacterized protein n=1 Tax=Colletotrichum sojae TaxID=2175907 RepID=A0A8H6IYD7_9PEZI|nr:hypothetical protein CSOJ01_11186 [Colletotrichum sojae]